MTANGAPGAGCGSCESAGSNATQELVAEYAPVEPARDPLARLTTTLATSGAQQLASELDPAGGQRHAEQRLRRARQDRRDIETSRWTPKRGHRLAAAQRREAGAATDLARAQRARTEQRHGDRPFVTQHDLEEQHARHLERVIDRLEATRTRDLDLDRGRGLGR